MGSSVPPRARLVAILGALILSPDTVLMRLTQMESSSEWRTAWGVVFYRAWGRMLFVPMMYAAFSAGGFRSWTRACARLGARRLWFGATLYMFQNVAFIVAASMTYVASVLAIIATGPLFSAAMSRAFLRERVPRHTWFAAVACVGWVLLIYFDAFETNGDPRHVLGTSIALLVPLGTGAYWVYCKANPDADMIPALAASGVVGQTLALIVLLTAEIRPDDPGGLAAPFIPASDGGWVVVVALVAQCLLVAAAFACLTLGARDVPAAEVSLYLLLELPLGTLFVWWATGETPPWRVFAGAGGLLCTMATESWTGIAESRREAKEKALAGTEAEAEAETKGGGVERSAAASAGKTGNDDNANDAV